MLVLTRKKSEAIRIGDDVLVKVIRTGRSTVKIGIDAPASVRVVRGELLILRPDGTTSPLPAECSPAAQKAAAEVPEEVPMELHVEAVCSDQFPHTHIA